MFCYLQGVGHPGNELDRDIVDFVGTNAFFRNRESIGLRSELLLIIMSDSALRSVKSYWSLKARCLRANFVSAQLIILQQIRFYSRYSAKAFQVGDIEETQKTQANAVASSSRDPGSAVAGLQIPVFKFHTCMHTIDMDLNEDMEDLLISEL